MKKQDTQKQLPLGLSISPPQEAVTVGDIITADYVPASTRPGAVAEGSVGRVVEYPAEEVVLTTIDIVPSQAGINQVADPTKRLLALQESQPEVECEFRAALRWSLMTYFLSVAAMGSGLDLPKFATLLFTEPVSVLHSASVTLGAVVMFLRLRGRRRLCPIATKWDFAPLCLLLAAALVAIPNRLVAALEPLRWFGLPVLAMWAFWPPVHRCVAFAKRLAARRGAIQQPTSIKSILQVGNAVQS